MGVGVAGDRVEGQIGCDRPRSPLQIPIAALPSAAGQIIRGRHVRPSPVSQTLEEGAPVVGASHIAAIDQQVGVGGEGIGPVGEAIALRLERLRIQLAVAQLDPTGGPMSQKMHRRDPLALGQLPGDLVKAIAIARQRHHFHGGIQPQQESIRLGHGRIYK